MKNLTAVTLFFFFPVLLFAVPSFPVPEVNAAAAILLDAETGRVLYEKKADQLIPPASMTKLMTIHTALKFINDGSVNADALVPVSADADFRNLPPRSSLMFIEQGQKVSLTELLKGLALPSGNDAGIAVAEFIAGSVENFVELMNQEAARLGMQQTHFADASGLSEENITTAREYATFCRYYIENNAEYLETLHKLKEFTYPKEENLSDSGTSVHGPITQYNHNLLIGRMPWVDGLKTGYIDESGYNFAVTAQHDGRRLVLVTMGGPGKNGNDGSLRRIIDATTLLTYGFYAWTRYTPEVPSDSFIEISGGERNYLKVIYSPASQLIIKTADADQLEFVPDYKEIILPVEEGSIIGEWSLVRNGTETLQSGTITAAESILKGNIFKRAVDFFRRR